MAAQNVQEELISLLVATFDELRQARTIADVAIIAGIAHQELLDLLGEPVQGGSKLLKTALDSF